MALYTWIYRRRKVVFFLLCGTTFLIIYLFLSLPPTNKNERIDEDYIDIPSIKQTVTRKYFATQHPPVDAGNVFVNMPETPKHTADKNQADEGKLILEPPQQVELADKPSSKEAAKKLPESDPAQKNEQAPPDAEAPKENAHASTIRSQAPGKNMTKPNGNGTVDQGKESRGFEKLVAFGEKLRNKTREVGEHVKNKTWAVLGMVDSPAEKPVSVIFHFNRWNLTVSFEDIGDIMKDTHFLNRRSPLDLHAPVLLSTQNRTANYTYKLKSHRGFCDCWEHHCMCCARLTHKRLHLNNTICSNFTYLSKSQEFDLVVSVDSKPIDKAVIQAHTPPVLCVGSTPKVADVCVRFFNTTFKVNMHSEHRTQLLGCTDFSLNLYNKTLALVPVDCFQIPGDPNHRHDDQVRFNDFLNWVP